MPWMSSLQGLGLTTKSGGVIRRKQLTIAQGDAIAGFPGGKFRGGTVRSCITVESVGYESEM